MVRINLFKTPAVKRRKKRKAVPVKMFILAGSALAAIIALGIGVWAVQSLLSKQGPRPVVADSGYSPSAYSGRKSVEDIVRDQVDHQTPVNDKTGLLDLPYSQLEENEKVNYELLFAGEVFAVLAATVPAPPDVQFETLAIDSFQTFRASGIGRTADIVRDMFARFRTKPVTILPRPQTSIRKSGNLFRFVISVSASFGLNTTDPRVDTKLAWLPLRSSLDMTVRSVEQMLKDNGIRTVKPLTRVSGSKGERYRRFVYHLDGKCSYDDFVRFSVQLTERRVACAIQTLRIKALSPSQVRVGADLLFTFKD